MIKIFQKIRMKSVNGGKLKNYLIYAFGEIFLVMIGILLALQVNTWNQQRIERKKEAKALVDLLEEVKINKQRIEAKQSLRFAVVPRLRKYITLLSSGEANYQSFDEFHSSEYIIGMTNPSNGVIDALISSGELNLISNDSLKYLLADWKDQAGNLYENEQILWSSTLDYVGYYEQLIIDPRQVWKDWDAKKIEDSFNRLQSKIPYRNKLIAYESCNRIVIEECKLVLSFIERIMTLLQREIKDKSDYL